MRALALARAAVWNADERRPRTPVRLLGHTVLLGVILLGVVFVAQAALGQTPISSLSPLATMAVTVSITGAAIVLATLLATSLLDRRSWADVGLSPDRAWWRDLGAGVLLGTGLQTGIFLTSLAAGWTRIEAVGGPGVLAALTAGAALMVAVGVYEELLFRGYYLVNLAEGLRAVPLVDARRAVLVAAVLTSLAFGGVHGRNPNATLVSSALIVAYGGYLALSYLLTEDLALPVGFHAAWNYAQGFVYGFPVSGIDLHASLLTTETAGPEVLTGGSFGPEAGLVGMAWVVLSLPLIWWWVDRTRGEVEVRDALAVPDLRTDAGGDGDRTVQTVTEGDGTKPKPPK